MSWWSSRKIEYGKLNISLIYKFIFICPSSIIKKVKTIGNAEGENNYKHTYNPVSARSCSFKERGITKDLLATILAEIKRPLTAMGTYSKLKGGGNVEETVYSILNCTTLADRDFELIVFREHSDMTDTEAIFYYIRNAFAHGSFEFKNSGGPVYYLESRSAGIIKAQMRLKESTLKKYITLIEKTPAQIKELRKK